MRRRKLQSCSKDELREGLGGVIKKRMDEELKI